MTHKPSEAEKTQAAISAYAERLAAEHGPVSDETLDAAADILAEEQSK